MQAQEVRERFVEFFEKLQHSKIPSSSLIPHNDDTLLFANAGMNQFKDYFTGKAKPANKRAVSIQKCVRAGGKHNDLDNVGFTARHHTFFEMLGNFSFGDYFKKEAIEMAWRFLTEELKIPAEKLYITVHHSDDEAFELWNKEIGVPETKIFRKGDKDNFWEMGELGPCGPCSEIFYDHGESYSTPNFKPGENQDILDDELRYVEIWNLVFMQFEKTPEGRVDLPNPSIDTGAGLERLCAVLQDKYWNYDTDLFDPIFKSIEEFTGKSYQNKTYQSSMRVVADHIRSCTMLLTDGVIPSNEGRGYVLRRIIRRAVRHLRELDAPAGSFAKLIPATFEKLGKEYPQNEKNIAIAQKFLELEETKFLETLDHGLKYLDEATKKDLKDNTLSGQSAFMLYDTFGFPLDLTQTILKERGLDVDTDGFNLAMEKRKQESKQSWKSGSNIDNEVFYSAKEEHGDTIFLGYGQLEAKSKLSHIFQIDDKKSGLLFTQTTFYAESGGQSGDQGLITSEEGAEIKVLDTIKPIDGLHVHLIDNKDVKQLQIGREYHLLVNKKNRMLTARNHSATHLLQSALIKTLGDHVKQAGSLVDGKRLRFDFTHMQSLTSDEIKSVEDLVNKQIQKSLNVSANEMSMDAALEAGALAMFGEKYGERVRVLKMGDFSTELCGGTHVNNTSEIGLFKIVSESSLAAGVRRVEALTSEAAINFLSERSNILSQVEKTFKVKGEQVISRSQQILNDIKRLEKEIKSFKDQAEANTGKKLFESSKKINGIDFVAAQAPEGSNIKKLSDNFGQKYQKGLLLLTSSKEGKLQVLIRSNGIDIDCSKILKDLLSKYNGRGGGRKDMAQGSSDFIEHSKVEQDILGIIESEVK